MTDEKQPADIWMALEQEGWRRMERRKKGRLPFKKFRDLYNQELSDKHRENLDILLPQYVQIETREQDRASHIWNTPPDLSDSQRAADYLGEIQSFRKAINADIRCIKNIRAIGQKAFHHEESEQLLNDRGQQLVAERNQLDQRQTAFVALDEQQGPKAADGKGRGYDDGERAPQSSGQAQGGAVVQQGNNADEPAGGAAAPPREANAVDREPRQDGLMMALPEASNNNARRDAAIAKEEMIERRRLGQLKDSWWAARDLGSGSWGNAFLYVKQNQYGMIVDRLAVKISRTPHEQELDWDLSGNDPKVPNEVAAMMLLRPLKHSDCFVRLRNWRGSRKEQHHKIYMEYCPFGNMFDVLRAHSDFYVPEPFVWFFYETLAKAGLLMERGDLEEQRGAGFWRLILHRDVKLENIFLGLNSSDNFKGYNMPKLGDFGLCLISDGGDVATWRSNYTGYRFHAPEVRADRLQGDENAQTIMSAKTNLWELALSIYTIMRRGNGVAALDGPQQGRGNDSDRQFYTTRRTLAPFTAREMQFYSEDLRNLVMECLEYLPRDRPSLDAVLQRIRRHTGSGSSTQDLARGLRHAPADHAGFTKFGLLLGREKWSLRSMLRDEPANPRHRPVPHPPKRKPKRDDGNDTDSSDDSLGGDPALRMLFDPAFRTPPGPRHPPEPPLGELGVPGGQRLRSVLSPAAAGAPAGRAQSERLPPGRSPRKRRQASAVDLAEEGLSPKKVRTT